MRLYPFFRTFVALSSCGATMLEFALVFPILLVMILSILDFAHVLAVRAILTKAAENGVNMATKIPNFDVDVDGPGTSQADKDNFCEARRRILEEATRLPLNTLVTDFNVGSGSQLVKYAYDANCLDPLTGNIVEWGAGVIRPGEMVQREDGAGGGLQNVPHQILGPDPNQTLKPEVLMKRAPIYMELEARVKMFLPFLGTITTSGVAYGFREDVPKGGFGGAGCGAGGGVGCGGGGTTTSTTSTTTTTGGVTTTTLVGCAVDWGACIQQNFVLQIFNSQAPAQCPSSILGQAGFCRCLQCKTPPGS